MNTEIRPEYLATGDIALVIGTNKDRFIVVIKSTKAFLAGLYVLPGGHRTTDDVTIAHTAANEARQEINLIVDPETLDDHLFMVLSGKDRDLRPKYSKGSAPDKHVVIDRITVVYLIEYETIPVGLKAGDDAASVHIFPLSGLQPTMMGFDHGLVITKLKKRYGIE